MSPAILNGRQPPRADYPYMGMGLNGAKQAKRAQTGPNGAGFFCLKEYFYAMEISCLATKALRQKLAELWGFC